jgi:hypothetical protein
MNKTSEEGIGGAGGGGKGGNTAGSAATSGTANTGGGGGGGALSVVPASGSGGSGVVILAIPLQANVTFSAGVTQTSAVVGSTRVYTVTATSTTDETVTIG